MEKILFICIGNSCRSQMAKGFFNAFSSSQSADSAGLKPEKNIDPYTIQVMNEVGIDVRFYVPKSLTLDMNNQFDIFVLMASSTDFPSIPWEKTLQWSIQDPKGKSLDDYRIVRNTIQNHVETLLADIKKLKKNDLKLTTNRFYDYWYYCY